MLNYLNSSGLRLRFTIILIPDFCLGYDWAVLKALVKAF